MDNTIVIIMAGGLGKRMNSTLPKVLHEINKKPMLVHVIDNAMRLRPLKIMVVVGKYRDVIEQEVGKYIELHHVEFIDQPIAMGTGHAILCCKTELAKYPNTKTLILSGDVPLLHYKTMKSLITDVHLARIVTTTMSCPGGYGRIQCTNGQFERIIEENDCNSIQKVIQKVNGGIYVFDTQTLCTYLPHIHNKNSQREYYLTDIVEIIKNHENIKIEMFEIPKHKQHEIAGVNTREQLIELEKQMDH